MTTTEETRVTTEGKTADDIEHGTYKGAQQHARWNIEMCDPCRLARNQYSKDFRRNNPTAAARSALRDRARRLAINELLEERPADFQAKYDRILAELTPEGNVA